MKPFLKWVGGKTQILEDVLGLFPTEIRDYYEPFVGGGSVLIGLLERVRQGSIRVTGTIRASDKNSALIGLYKAVQSAPDALLLELKRLVEEFSKCGTGEVNRSPTSLTEAQTSPESYYYWVRAKFNTTGAGIPNAAMFLFLNKTCFRGLYREGPRGFNVPFGNYKNPTVFEEEHIRQLSTLLQPVVFTECSFQEALRNVVAGDFVYMDPPYAPESGTSFVGYVADGFSAETHTELFEACKSMQQKGVALLLSNADVQTVRGAFVEPVFVTRVISCRRAIHSKKPGSKTNEVLITSRLAAVQ